MAPVLRFPRPRAFLHLISLRTATEFITFSLAINKVTGFYGILALFTGYHLNPLQLSHYIYSILVLGLICYLSPAIRQRDADGALKVLALAWLYVLDTILNSLYTTMFGLGWFILLAQHLNERSPLASNKPPGGSTMNETAGFTDPEHSVSEVEVVATPAPGAMSGQDAIAYGAGDSSALSGVLFQQGSMASVFVIGLLWAVRVYLCVIVLSYARTTLRQHVANSSSTSYTQSDDPTMAENPFRLGREEGEGWRGQLGRFMLRFPSQRYWLGRDETEEWVRATSGRFESGRRALRIKVPEDNGLGERERRARSGTGPPVPGVKDKTQQ
ncbi:hypothetical protein NU195Hw_g2504t1 [Hortaea werneckii]